MSTIAPTSRHSERDLLRKKALTAALGLGSARVLGIEPEYLNEIRLGLDFCRAMDRACELSGDQIPVHIPDLPIWEALRNVVSDAAAMNSSSTRSLTSQLPRVEALLTRLLGGDRPADDDLAECERFFQAASILLQ